MLIAGLHVLMATAFIQIELPAPSLANGVAFVVATIFSYLINTAWSFSITLHERNLIRFCFVSFVGLSFAMTVPGIAQYYGLNYWHGITVFVVYTILPVEILLHNLWTYR
jgi:putative flippase GtrA